MRTDILRTDGHRFRALAPTSDAIRALQAMARGRDDLVGERIALATACGRCSMASGLVRPDRGGQHHADRIHRGAPRHRGYLVPFYFVYWPAPVHWDQAPLLDVVFALSGGAVAIFCIGGLGEQFLLRRLLWYKLALLAAGIVVILHPADLSHALAVLLAGYVLLTEVLQQRNAGA